jgi:hypothetical protein
MTLSPTALTLGTGVNLVCGGSISATATAGNTQLTLTDSTNAKSLFLNSDNGVWKFFDNTPALKLSISGSAVTLGTGVGMVVADTTDATSTTAASLKTAGGLAVAKKLYVGTDIFVGAATVSSSGGLTVGVGNNTGGVFKAQANTGGAVMEMQAFAAQGYIGSTSNVLVNFLQNNLVAGILGTDGSWSFQPNKAGATALKIETTAITANQNIVMASGKGLQTVAAYLEGSEMTAPAAPAANGFRLFAEDNGSGKTRLMVQFATGAAQQLAIEP